MFLNKSVKLTEIDVDIKQQTTFYNKNNFITQNNTIHHFLMSVHKTRAYAK